MKCKDYNEKATIKTVGKKFSVSVNSNEMTLTSEHSEVVVLNSEVKVRNPNLKLSGFESEIPLYQNYHIQKFLEVCKKFIVRGLVSNNLLFETFSFHCTFSSIIFEHNSNVYAN